jgi:hypothetical protein
MSEEKNKFSWDPSGSTLSFNDAYKTPLTLEESLNNISFRLDINGNLEVSNEYGEVWNSTLTANKLLSLLDINSIDITNWDTAYGWGDHSTEGYITGYTETDPVFTASPAAGITTVKIGNWDTAYSWGNHTSAGYLTEVPALAITDTFVVNNQLTMLALDAQKGDVAIRTDINTTFILSTNSPTILADWKEILTPADGVTSVAMTVPTGLTVSGSPIISDGILAVSFTSGYSIPTNTKQTEWDNKAPINNPTFTGTVNGVTATMVGLGNVTNESKTIMFADPTFTGTVSGVTASMVDLGNVTNESKTIMFTDPTFTGAMNIPTIVENGTVISATANSSTTLSVLNGISVYYFTDNNTANWTINFQGTDAISLDTLAIGKAVTVSILARNGATPYRPTSFSIQGSAVTPRWQGGTAPTAGNANSTDVYTFTIIRLASGFELLASQTRFV